MGAKIYFARRRTCDAVNASALVSDRSRSRFMHTQQSMHARDSESERRIQANVLLMSAGPMLGEVRADLWILCARTSSFDGVWYLNESLEARANTVK